MRTLLRTAAPLVLAAAALLALWLAFRSRSDALGLVAERARLKREFVERSLPARSLAEARHVEAAEEARLLLRWYADELDRLQKLHPRIPMGAAPEAVRAGSSAEARQTAEEFARYAGERWQALRAGRHDPLFLAGAGGLRLDVLAIEAGRHPASGARGVRIDFALWGVPRRTERGIGTGGRGERSALAASLPRLTLKFADAAGKPCAEMSGSGEPYLALADPERFVEDFPPGILFGTWWLEAFPREAARVSLALQATVPGVGPGSASATLGFDAPVAEDWKVKPGEVFGGAVREDPSLAPPAPAGKGRAR
jgi:hypothetical protein